MSARSIGESPPTEVPIRSGRAPLTSHVSELPPERSRADLARIGRRHEAGHTEWAEGLPNLVGSETAVALRSVR